MISLESVSKSFDSNQILKNISLQVETGESVSIIGPGGCGKTTLLKIILGLIKPDSGSVHVLETNMATATELERQETLKKIGMAFQQGALFDYMTVRENLEFAMEHMTTASKEEMLTRITDLLSQVKLHRTLDMFPYELSGGMQRRVGVARALATSPTVAIFDEPTSGLDPVTSTIILNMIREISAEREGVSTIVATSAVEIAIRFADRLIVLNEGTVVADGSWKKLLVEGSDWVKHFLAVRLIGIDLNYAKELDLPQSFIDEHW